MKEWKNEKAMAIIRVSSHRQKDNYSHDTQEQEIKEYCKQHGLNLIYVEKMVESAKNSESRTKYHAAIDKALKEKIKHIIFYMKDREARNFTDHEFNERLVRRDLILLHYARDNKVLHKDSPPSEFLMRDFQAIQDKAFSANLSAKVNDAMATKAEKGWYPGNHAPLGYVHKKDIGSDGRELKRGTTIVSDPDIRNVRQVQREYELRANGLTLDQIREQIIREGYEDPAKKNYHRSTVHKRLLNSFYRGSFHWQGQDYQGRHELIISPEILRKVDQSFGRKGPRTFKGGIFSGGWLHCSECGCQIIYDPKQKPNKAKGTVTTHHYYHCSNGKKVHQTMKGMNITEDKIWDQLGKALDLISISEEFAVDIAEALNETQVKSQEATKKQIADFKVALEGLETRRNKVFDIFLTGTLSEEEYKLQTARVKTEQDHYIRLLENAQLELNNACIETAKVILELAISAKSLWISRPAYERRELLNQVLSNPVLDGVTVRYELKKPFAVLAEMSQDGDWRSQGDLNPCILREREVS